MSSGQVSVPPKLAAAFDALSAAIDQLAAFDLDGLDARIRLQVLEWLETAQRRQKSISHRVIAGLAQEEPAALGGPVRQVIGDWLRISCAEARRRVHEAEQLAPRLSLTGQPMPPQLPATAQAWQCGLLDGEHLQVIRKFTRELPIGTPVDVVERAERFLADQAVTLRPDQLAKVADRYAVVINPDGKFSDADRGAQRGFSWSPQRADGMSIGRLRATPELRAYLDTWFARFAAPGMCNPADQTPVVNGEPSPEVAERDSRSHPQRQHDAMIALVRGQLGDPALGQHRGLPVALVVSATLEQITSASGHAVTGGGTLLPMADLIRMAAHAWHYLAVFDTHDARPLYLGRTKRIATADQRMVLHNKDRGCTHPGCDAPGYRSEVHHVDEWATGGLTNIDKLTFGCKPHHKLLDQGWRTRKLADGTTEWQPPPQQSRPGGVNTYHHPERLLPDDD